MSSLAFSRSLILSTSPLCHPEHFPTSVILSIFPLCHPERSEGSFSHRILRSAKEDPSSASPPQDDKTGKLRLLRMTRRESFAPQDDRVGKLRFSGGQGGKTALLRETGRENCTPQGDRAGKLCGSEGQKCMSLWDDKMEQYAAQNDKMKYSAAQNSKKQQNETLCPSGGQGKTQQF